MKRKRKVIPFEIKEINDEERSFLAVASTEDIDRDHDRILSEGWDLGNFQKNPVIPWAHRYSDPPVAQALDVYVSDTKLMFRPKFATKEEYAFADTIYRLYKGGYLRAFSVGFDPKRYEIIERGKGRRGYDFLEQELWEISACTVPSNPNALAQAKAKGVITDEELEMFEEPDPGDDIVQDLNTAEVKGICGARNLPINDREAWDADAAEARIRTWAGGPNKEDVNWNKYKRCFVFRDEAQAEEFGGYKLPFADIIDGTATATWGGVHNAMGAVVGGRGGMDLPEGDRKACHSFLAGYYKKFDKPVPDFKDPVELRLDRLEEKMDEALARLSDKKQPEDLREEEEIIEEKTETPSLDINQVVEALRPVIEEALAQRIDRAVDKRIKYHLGIVD